MKDCVSSQWSLDAGAGDDSTEFAIDAATGELTLVAAANSDGSGTGISSNVITSIGESSSGNILVGTYSGGLNVYDRNSDRFVGYQNNPVDPDALHSENVWTLLVDSEDQKWLGLLGTGADIFDEQSGKFKNIGPYSDGEQLIGHPNVMSLMEDADGDIWFGTEGAGGKESD